MAKPSIVAAGIVIVLSVGLIAIEAAGLGIFLSEYDDLSVITFVTAAKLVGVFTPFAAIPVSTALNVANNTDTTVGRLPCFMYMYMLE